MCCMAFGAHQKPRTTSSTSCGTGLRWRRRWIRPATTCCSSPMCSGCAHPGTAIGASRSRAASRSRSTTHPCSPSALAAATENLGIVFTSSIVQDHPFDFARRMSSLDHYTDGRLGWNIVTSFNENMFRSFGHEGTLAHDERYEWAYEYVDVTYKLLGEFPGTRVRSCRTRSAVCTPIHRRSTRSTMSASDTRSKDPHFSSPSPQRTPVLFQAGSSPAGQLFSARNAEGVYISSPDPLPRAHSPRRPGLWQQTTVETRRASRSPRACRS